MKLTDKVGGRVHLVCCAVLFVLAWAFWAFVHPEELSYQEERQLFVFDGEYFASNWWRGLPGMLSAFLMQFYNNVLVGAAIIAAIYVLILHIGWTGLRRSQKNDYKHYIFSGIFVLLIWLIMAFTNANLTSLVFITLVLLLIDLFSHRFFHKEGGSLKGIYKVLFTIVLVFLCFNDGYRTVGDTADWSVQKYDYMARQQDWEGIMQKARNDEPRNYVSNAYINLAFGMKGALSQRGDESGRRHRGLENAFPEFDGNFMTGCALSDIYYYLGLINTSNKYAHRALETLPDGNLSARMVKRIIETDIINRDYDDARKYLDIMMKTIFYRKWAEKNLALLDNEDAISRHNFYGYARRVRIPDDNVKAGQKMDEVILSLVKQNNENYLAIQYYLLIPQLEHNDKKYEMYLNYVEKKMK